MTLNKPLAKNLRSQLENTVKAARDVAENAAQAALTHLGVGDSEAPTHLTEAQKVLRRRLRAHGRQLGDIKHANDTQPIRHLVWEVAYEHWHRMLFARFLAENNLLMYDEESFQFSVSSVQQDKETESRKLKTENLVAISMDEA